MIQEANAHSELGHWEVWLKADVPTSQDILPSVWAFRRKRRIDTRAVYKHKARLNIHGGMQTYGKKLLGDLQPGCQLVLNPALSDSDIALLLENQSNRLRSCVSPSRGRM